MYRVVVQYGHKDRKDIMLVINSDKIADEIRRDSKDQTLTGGVYDDPSTKETIRVDWKGAAVVQVMPY